LFHVTSFITSVTTVFMICGKIFNYFPAIWMQNNLKLLELYKILQQTAIKLEKSKSSLLSKITINM
jgi:hypothetical protein